MKTLCISQEGETRKKCLSTSVGPDMRTNTGKKKTEKHGTDQGRSSTYVKQIAHECTKELSLCNKLGFLKTNFL